ncbi:MAG TPA: DUF1015 domain-containing protein [Candidatus Limnocylindrales bacterium]|nr:DUF1015 domain-containing protein [Candidatus Limnocylindrales bacterium]
MPLVRPLRAIAYSPERFAQPAVPERVRLSDEPAGGRTASGRAVTDLTDLACPPYDVISTEQQEGLLARHPANAIRLELPPGPEPHAAAAATLARWLDEGTLERRAAASVYYYAFASAGMPDEPTVQGVLARVLLEPFGADVRAHEHTMPGPKAERLAHLRAMRTQVSPILALYFDRSERYRHVMGRSWTDEWRARDADGLLHTLGEVEPDDRLLSFLSKQRLYIADGHHRYETALAYHSEVRSRPALADAAPGALAADWIMAVLVNAEVEELDIRPTHRLIRGDGVGAVESLASEPGSMWQAEPMAPEALAGRLEALRELDQPVFGLVLPGGRGYLVTGDRQAATERMARERVSTAVGRLDLALLQAALLDDVLGIDAGQVAAGERLAYTRSEAEARRAVESGEAQAAVLVRPTRLEELAAVAMAGDVMPQKSTYFYPKLLTGMVFNPLED